MTDSDRQMDRDLSALPALEPARSVWPQLEREMAAREKKRRLGRVFRYATPAVAASLAVAVLLVFTDVETKPAPVDSLALKKTVEHAVKNARPEATFSSLELKNGRPVLEALLVSAKQRPVGIAPAVESTGKGKTGDKTTRDKDIDEF